MSTSAVSLSALSTVSAANVSAGGISAHLRLTSASSRTEVARLVARWDENRMATGQTLPRSGPPFVRKYAPADAWLLVEMGHAIFDVGGSAVVHLLRRTYTAYGDPRYERLTGPSVSHLYSLGKGDGCQARRMSFTKIRPVCNPIGVRKTPRPKGRAEWAHIDSVHQGDLDGFKGDYHTTCVDPVRLIYTLAAPAGAERGWGERGKAQGRGASLLFA